MFKATRLKLTGWYLVIIMFVSLIFSIVIYVSVTNELSKFESFQELRSSRITTNFGSNPLTSIGQAIDQELISEAKRRLIGNLVILNALILVGSTIAGFFLAGRTLMPIKKMIETQTRFIGDAAHELKTPLTSLRSEIEVYFLSKKHPKIEAENILKSNLEEVIRLQNLSDSLMQLTSYESKNTSSVVLTKISIVKIIENAIKKINPQAKAKQILIKNLVKNMYIMADERSLVQLFVLLLDNAVKYSFRQRIITISSFRGEAIIVKIIDEGIGMTEEEVKHVFDRFYRVDKSRNSNDTPGYGLGLSIANEIIRLHKGQINIKSKPLKGSTFSVILPKAYVKRKKTQ